MRQGGIPSRSTIFLPNSGDEAEARPLGVGRVPGQLGRQGFVLVRGDFVFSIRQGIIHSYYNNLERRKVK